MYCIECQQTGVRDISSWCCVLGLVGPVYDGIYQAVISVPTVCGIVTCWAVSVCGRTFQGITTPQCDTAYAVTPPFPVGSACGVTVCFTSNDGADTARTVDAKLIEWPIGNLMCICREGVAHCGDQLEVDVACWGGSAAQGSDGYPSVNTSCWNGVAVSGTLGYPDVNICKWLSTGVCGVGGYPGVDVRRWVGCSTCGTRIGGIAFPQVDICAACGVMATASGGYLEVDVACWGGIAAAGCGGQPAVDVCCWGGCCVQGSGGYPCVDVCCWGGWPICGCVAGGTMYPYVEVCRWANCAVGEHAGLPCVFVCDAGTGSISVDHDYGGTDALAYIVDGGTPVEDALVQAYLTTAYDAGQRTRNYVKGETRTDANGRWETEMRLNADAYTLVYYKQGEYGPDTTEITVTALP